MPGQPFGVYLHVPFCLTRCGYCDFNTYTPAQLGGVSPDRWLLALRAELELAAAKLDAPTVHTVYVGGGTPSLLGGERLATLLDMVRDHFVLAPDAEVSTEANPESTWPEFFATIRAAGYTRVSLGMQSVAPRVLATLDRVHSPGRAAAAATEAIAEGFTHVNLDLIYGTPGESDDDLVRSVDAAVQAGVDHVSAYALVVEHGTALARRVRRGELAAPPMTTCWRIATSWSMLGCRRPGLPGTRCPIGVDRAASAGTTWVIGTVASGGAQVRARTATLA